MQLAIDISVEPPEALELAANFLMQHAALKRAGSLPAYTGGVPFGSSADVPAGTTEIPTPPPVIPTPPPASNVVNIADHRDAAFRGHSDASPLVPSAGAAFAIPPAPVAAVIPTAPTVSATVPNAPVSANVTPAAPAGTTDEYDSAGMPWDARIHQKGKGTKKDKTWKLQKGIDEKIVEAVTQELFASGRVRAPNAATNTPAPVGASAPVVVPPAPNGTPTIPTPPSAAQIPPPPGTEAQAGGVQIPPPPQVEGGQAQIPPPPALAQAEGQAQAGLVPPAPGVPLPAAAVLGVPNGGNAGVVQGEIDPFRAFVAKVTAARTAGKITAEQVTALIQAAGAPSLQLLKNMPHLLPAAELELDTHLASV